MIPLGAGEQHSFEWFLKRSAVKLPGAFKADSWISLLFQASTTEAAVRHAVLALSSAHQEEVRGFGSLGSECNDEVSLFTVKQYSKAISNLQPSITKGAATSDQISLISCVLFAYMEFLRGHYNKGFLHLQYGVCLLEETPDRRRDHDPASMHVGGWIITHITMLLTQSRLLHQPIRIPASVFLYSASQPHLDAFRSAHHARRSLEHLMLRTFSLQDRYIHAATDTRRSVAVRLASHRQILEIELGIWLQTYEQTMSMIPASTSEIDRFAYFLLQVYWYLAIILVQTCLEPSELAFDRQQDNFLEIISHCIEMAYIRQRTLQIHHDPEPNSPNSTSDIGWIPLLFFTALKCRNHRIRHQAVALVAGSSHKEGPFSSLLSVIIARKVIEIEEGTFYGYLNSAAIDRVAMPTSDELSSSSLPEQRRLKNLQIRLPDDREGRIELIASREGYEISTKYELTSRCWSEVACKPHC